MIDLQNQSLDLLMWRFYLVNFTLHLALFGTRMKPLDFIGTLLNVTMFLCLLVIGYDIGLFYTGYELIGWAVVPMILVASRAVRKGHALVALLWVNCAGLMAFIGLVTGEMGINLGSDIDWHRLSMAGVCVAVICAAKCPSWPLVFWLPEAHVECS